MVMAARGKVCSLSRSCCPPILSSLQPQHVLIQPWFEYWLSMILDHSPSVFSPSEVRGWYMVRNSVEMMGLLFKCNTIS